MTDITKSRNYELLCEILGLAIEIKRGFYVWEETNNSYSLRITGFDFPIYDFTLDKPAPELEKAKSDLLNYKKQQNG